MDETTNVFENCGKVFSLEKMCFDLIVKNFERFYFGFTVSKDEYLQRHFEFLQRRYSVQLVSSLYVYLTQKEEYFEFLLNEHLNFLDGKWFVNSRHLNSMENIFCRLPNLKKLRFRRCRDEILENVAKFCPKIVEIDVRFSEVTDNGVKYLCEKNGTVSCPEIKILLIENSCVTDRAVEYLIRSLPLLEKIDYPNVPVLLHSIHQENVSKFQKVQSYNLVEINVLQFQGLPNFTDVLKTCLTICPNLESFDCSITDKEQLDLFASSRLKKLYLSMRDINPKFNIDSFIRKNGCNLTSLTIYKCIISVSILAEYCPHLKEFSVVDVNFVEEEDGAQVTFPCLMKSSFTEINPPAAKAFCLLLSSSPKLVSISFNQCRLSLIMKKQILMWCKNASTEQIEFHYLKLEMKFVRDILLTCPFLWFMCLDNCYFDVDNTEKFLESLAKKLPNQPYVNVINYSDLFHGMRSYSSRTDDSALYWKTHPEERYESSNSYDSLFHEIYSKVE